MSVFLGQASPALQKRIDTPTFGTLPKQLGIDIGFETYDQMYSGVRVFGDPQPGDIILMYYGAWPNYNPMLPEHVVLYAGGGMIYEEPAFGGRCQYVSLASKGASTTTAQRILS